MWCNLCEISRLLFDTFYPLKRVTLSYHDPDFMTPEIKSLLRCQNTLIHSGKIDEANAIASKVGFIIASSNSTKLTHIHPKHCTSDLWDEVRRLTKASPNIHTTPSSLIPTILNSHYASISSNPNYIQPPHKLCPNKHREPVIEMEVFKLLDF